jgi:hypothetical protein
MLEMLDAFEGISEEADKARMRLMLDGIPRAPSIFSTFLEPFKRAGRERRALKALRAKSHPTRFDISWSAMRAAIREARDDLAAGQLKHIHQCDAAEGLCFNMGIHRVEANGYSIVGLIGLVERKLGLPVTGMIDVMRDAPDNSLWDLFYPKGSPVDIENITPQEIVAAIDRWLARSPS